MTVKASTYMHVHVHIIHIRTHTQYSFTLAPWQMYRFQAHD